ncbi:hypothetical protein GPALN_006956 [Globodera pallida]|nr:hypothetical protein GPALN_006956 [Globodera pallida]
MATLPAVPCASLTRTPLSAHLQRVRSAVQLASLFHLLFLSFVDIDLCLQVVRLLPSDKKLTVLLVCADGELFPLTIFKNLASQNAFVKACVLGNVLKVAPLKAQRFSEKFDGKMFFNSPLDYEFVVKNNTKFEVLPAAVQSAQNFDDLCSGGLYQIKCIIASAFVPIDNMFACVVGDTKNKRADLYVHGVSLSEKLGSLKPNDQLHLAKCYSRIDDECLTISASVDHLEPMNRSIVWQMCWRRLLNAKDNRIILHRIKKQGTLKSLDAYIIDLLSSKC